MRAGDVINDIRTRFPTTFSDEKIIDWLNVTIDDIWKDVAVEEVKKGNLTAGRRTYLLPDGVEFTHIKAVVVDGHEYGYLDIGAYTKRSIYYKITGRVMGVNPVPYDNSEIVIYYEKRPAKLTKLDDEIEINPDYIELLKNGVFMILAKNMNDVPLANNYIQDFNRLLARARQERWEKGADYPKIKVVQ